MKELQIFVEMPKLPEIGFDFAKADSQLTKLLEPYQNLVVTPDTIQGCKKASAELNIIKKTINDQKIKIKKAWNEPYLQLEENLKKLMEKCDEGNETIKQGLEYYEIKRIELKTKNCNELLEQKKDECGLDDMFVSRIYLPDKFTNSSMTMKAIEDHLDTEIINLTNEQDKLYKEIASVETHIDTMNTAFELKTPLTYDDFERQMKPENFNLSWLMEDVTKRAKSRHEAENKVIEEITEEPQPEIEIKTPKLDEEVISYTLEIDCTANQFKNLKTYMAQNGIVFQEQIEF